MLAPLPLPDTCCPPLSSAVLCCATHPRALRRALDKGAQFVLLGSGHSDGEFKKMAEQQFKDHPDIR
jgi:hypothetical protein